MVAITSLTGRLDVVLAIMVAMLVGSVAVAFWYSYRVWRDDPDKRTMTGGV